MTRCDIYYWKCDRPAAFHRTERRAEDAAIVEPLLQQELQRHFDRTDVVLSPGCGQGNHLTWNADVGERSFFIRVENGPERDGQLAIESAVLDRVRDCGVRTPIVFGCDASRSRVPFAWQALERISAPDLNHWLKQDCLDQQRIAFEIGAAVARWQTISLPRFGVLDSELRGYHATYADYFCLRLEEHLNFLVTRGFLSEIQRDEIASLVNEHQSLLQIERGCLVHKDLALWNVLGSPTEVAAIIDFDDAISGDPLDDLSLLGCFHDAAFLQRACEGYQSLSRLPCEYRRRFWLHLLRNMLVKSVIRVGAGYFERTEKFFLIGKGGTGADLRLVTQQRLADAVRGLREDAGIWGER